MGAKKKKRGGRVLRFAVSGALLVGASGAAVACEDEPEVNEPFEHTHTVNEPADPVEPEETVNPPPEPVEPVHTNERPEPVPPPPPTPAEEPPHVNTPAPSE